MKSRWHVIPSFPEYEIRVGERKEGEVRRANIKESKYTHRTYPGRLLKPVIRRQGYVEVTLCRAGRKLKRFVHVLVAEVFFGPKPKGLDVNHEDLDKTNNGPDNLEYVTRKMNIRHAIEHGAIQLPGVGEEAHCNKLTWRDVHVIRALYEDGQSQRDLARKFGVTPGTIAHIVKWRTWVRKAA
jgi:hypothetical protein